MTKKDLNKAAYEAPAVATVGSLSDLTRENYPSSGSDVLSFLPGFGS